MKKVITSLILSAIMVLSGITLLGLDFFGLVKNTDEIEENIGSEPPQDTLATTYNIFLSKPILYQNTSLPSTDLAVSLFITMDDEYFVSFEMTYQDQSGDDCSASQGYSHSISTDDTYNWILHYEGGSNLTFAFWGGINSTYRVKNLSTDKTWYLTSSNLSTLSSYKGILPVFYRTSDVRKISFDAQGGTLYQQYNYVKVNSYIENMNIYLDGIPYRSGYKFMGYYTSPNGGGTQYIDERGQGVRACDFSTDTTLYAYWDVIDTTPPVIHRSIVQFNNDDGYYVYAYVTDNIGVNRVQFPTWTEYNGQDDIQSEWATSVYAMGDKGSWTVNGEEYNYRYYVAVSDHNNEIGLYHTHIYAYDAKGNWTNSVFDDIMFTWLNYAASSYAGGNGTQNSPYIIKTPEQLALLAKESRSSTLSGKYYKLGANIDLSEHIWPGIGNDVVNFEGNFNGDMYTIRNMKTSTEYKPEFAGLFLFTKNATLSNIIIEDCDIVSTNDTGVLITKCLGVSSLVQNCIVRNSTITSVDNSVGAIAGYCDQGTVLNCWVENVTFKCLHVGGIIGWCEESARIIDCAVKDATLTATTEYINIVNGRLGVGTIVGCYGYGTENGTATKVMYGDSTAWGNWGYSSGLNGGYPVQKKLFHIGKYFTQTSKEVHDYLVTKGFGNNLYNPSKASLDAKIILNSDNSFTFVSNPSGSGIAFSNFFYSYDGKIPPNTPVTVVYELLSSVGKNNICFCSPYDMGSDPSDVGAYNFDLSADSPTGNKPSIQVVKFTTNGNTNRDYNFRSYISYNLDETINMRFRISVFIGDIDIDANNFEYGFPH